METLDNTGSKDPDKTLSSPERHNAIVDALVKSVEIFTSHSEQIFEDVMTNGLRSIAEAAELQRIAVYQSLDERGTLGQTYVWSHGRTTQLDDDLIELPRNGPVISWLKILEKGECINTRTDRTDAEEAAFLSLFNVKSILFVPIFTHNKFWGIVTLEDQIHYRYFDEDCLDLLRSAARLCASALIRREMTQNADKAMNKLLRREQLMSALNKMAVTFLSESNETFDDTMAAGVQYITDAIDLDRMSIWRNFSMPNGLHTSQIYRWERASGGTTPSKPELLDVTYSVLVPQWEELLGNGGSRNGPVEETPEAAVLQSFGIVSVFATPIFINQTFWGLALFEDIRNKRHFEDDATETMRLAAFLCANTVLRAEMERKISETNEFNRILLDAAPTGFTIIDENLKVLDCNDSILKLFETEKEYFLSHFAEFSPEYQNDGQRSDEKAASIIRQAAQGKRLASEWTHRSKSGKLIPFEITLAPITYNGRAAALGYQYDVTNLKKMEQELTDANEFNRAVIDAAPIGLTVIDENLNIIDCNEAIMKVSGSPSRQFFIDHFYDFSPEYQPDDSISRGLANERIKRTLDTGEKIAVEWMHCSFTGEEIPSEVTLTRVKHKGKNIVLGYQYDLRNIKKMEDALTEAEELTRFVTEASPISYVLFDENMNPIDCNEATMQIFECSDKQFLLDNYWALFLPESQPDGNVSFEKAMVKKDEASANTSGKATFEWVHRSLKGELIPMENTLTRVVHKGRGLIISFKYDLRSTKKMTENINIQSELLKTRLEQQELMSDIAKSFISKDDIKGLIETALEKIGCYMQASRVVIVSIDYVNNLNKLEYSWYADGAPRLQTAIFSFKNLIVNSFPIGLPDGIAAPIISCTNTAEHENDDFRIFASLDIRGFIFASLYVDGRLWGILSIEQCSEPRKWTDDEKSFFAMTASSIAGAITRDIYNERLKEALEKATVASKAKSEFLSNMSHEIRTPMNAIIGMTAIGKNTADQERKNYALTKIEDASTHLLGVINDILDMSKIEANKFELSPVDFNFEKMLQRVVDVVNFRVGIKRQKLMVYIDKSIPENLIGDDQRIAQVITNLMGNAVKFTPEKGSISLNTRFLGEEDGICTLQISVTDTGIGITPGQLGRLFTSFEQAESSTTRKYGGTGLGLAISKSIVELMGGKIWVESKPDKGSVFTFTIKAKRGEGKRHILRDRAKKWENIRVLAVDDDPDILEFFKEIGNRYNLCCDTALSGEEALRLVERNSDYDIFFIDWKMPGIDGIALSGALKAMERYSSNAVVIMISAGEWSEVEKEAKVAGVDKFLSKPLFPATIADTISDCLEVEQHKEDDSQYDTDISFSGHSVLLVEDVEINREIVITLLEPMNLKIDCAENGAQAVKKFISEPDKYEMIFMDIQMPEMDGYEATRRIRAFEAEQEKSGKPPKRVPIVAMTANVFREDIEKCLEAGMDSHIGKPLDLSEVVEQLRTHLPK